MNDDTDAPKLHIDSDWKAEAQREKEKLAAEVDAAGADGAGPGAGQLPDASFKTIVGMFASQALMGLGTMADPQGRGVMVDLDGAKLSIDLLAVLEEKTKGNLSAEEADDLSQVVAELRSRFVQISQAVAQQMTGGAPLTDDGAGGGGVHLS